MQLCSGFESSILFWLRARCPSWSRNLLPARLGHIETHAGSAVSGWLCGVCFVPSQQKASGVRSCGGEAGAPAGCAFLKLVCRPHSFLPCCPAEGERYQELRQGKLALLPGRNQRFQQMIRQLMHPDAAQRPSPAKVLASQLVQNRLNGAAGAKAAGGGSRGGLSFEPTRH